MSVITTRSRRRETKTIRHAQAAITGMMSRPLSRVVTLTRDIMYRPVHLMLHLRLQQSFRRPSSGTTSLLWLNCITAGPGQAGTRLQSPEIAPGGHRPMLRGPVRASIAITETRSHGVRAVSRARLATLRCLYRNGMTLALKIQQRKILE